MSALAGGQSFGKYRIVRLLGRGSMGVVYLAEDETLGRDVALKILNQAHSSDAVFEERFRREAKIIARLDHPNIVQIHSLEKVEGMLAIDMAYLEGGPVNLVTTTPVQLVGIACDVLEALACCHASKIVHRDVKPSNVLLAPSGHALLGDFGLAKLRADQQSIFISSMTSSCMFVGTPRYAPPEAWDGAEPTPAWDVYSMGMMLYERLAPQPPYSATTPYSLIKQMIERPLPRLVEVADKVSQQLSETVEQMLAPNPVSRIPTAEEALAQLYRTPEYETGAAMPSTLQVRRKKIPRLLRAKSGRFALVRVRSFLPLLGTIALAMAVLAAVYLWLSRPPAVQTQMEDRAALAPGDARSFDIIDPSVPTIYTGGWLMQESASSEGVSIVAYLGPELWVLEGASSKADAFTLAGNWAGYVDPRVLSFQYGTLTGEGHWTRPGREIAVTVDRKNAAHGGSDRKSVVVRVSEQSLDAQAFLQKLEGADFIPALLYNEVQPRALPWLDTFEQRWLSQTSTIANVIEVDTALAPFTLDGVLSEAFWSPPLSPNPLTLGVVQGQPAGQSATLMIHHDGSALLLGMHSRQAPLHPLLQVSLSAEFDVITGNTPRWNALFDGNTLRASAHTGGGQELPWACDWEGATAESQGRWSAEVRIPFAGLESVSAPQAGKRWRMNCSVMDGDRVPLEPVTWWGSEDLLETTHGMVLIFSRDPRKQ
ncbi:MAG: protein kinase [Candidatus Hydrogenedentes bacterium]|nr:protein kinase [Candidatus Hydrogenedentota bacterium]